MRTGTRYANKCFCGRDAHFLKNPLGQMLAMLLELSISPPDDAARSS